jgi:acyl-CoA reductase-like NAD-dependent aldehyde dehydrogenase
MTYHVRLFVDGAWVDAEDGRVFDAVNPSTGEALGTIAEGTRVGGWFSMDGSPS